MTEPKKQPFLCFGHGYTYIALKGSFIDAVGSQCQGVPSQFVENRYMRDGGEHSHLTLIHPKELKKALEAAGIEVHKKHKTKAMRALIAWIVEKVGEPATWQPNDHPVDLGLAFVSDQESEAYYRVLRWSMGEDIRHQLGLERAFFHVTVGFHPKDVHGPYKGPGTLLVLQQTDQDFNHLVQLIQMAQYYTNDTVFVNALAHQCSRYKDRLSAQSIDWTHIQEHVQDSATH